MKWNVTEEVADLLNLAQASFLVPDLDTMHLPLLNRSEIEQVLPHREPFLFLDEIIFMDEEQGVIVAKYDLERGRVFLEGHFPGAPTWPGIFQVEAITQAGGLLFNYTHKIHDIGLLTNVLAARFMEKITPGADLYIVARVLDYGQLVEIVGQTIQNRKICSVAATRFYSLSEEI
jgi:3-hydroxyacyl-[acyl-carrier-protein] dehydratase